MKRSITLVAIVASGCGKPDALPACVEGRPDGGPAIETGGDPVLLAAGDVAVPVNPAGARETARMLDARSGVVALLGDGVQGDGSIGEFLGVYAPTWGRHRWRTRPTPGNHEYRTPHAGPYFAYFCAAAGKPFEGWYSYDLGSWHVVVLNSGCVDASSDAPACDAGSAQLRWLAGDLAAHPARCTLAYWHRPRFNSGYHGDADEMKPAWDALYQAGAEIVLGGHAHDYERFAPQTPDGAPDPARGIRQFVVGTGGAGATRFDEPHAASEVRLAGVWGIVELTLHDGAYDWRFVATDDRVLDEGSASCH